jgi:small subunit ribosomal protein S8
MLKDSLAIALSNILGASKIGRNEAIVKPASKLIKEVLNLLNVNGYLGTFEEITAARGGVLKVNLIGSINKCGVVKPRFSIKKDGFEKFEKRYLPAKGMGLIIVSTQDGLITHEEAKAKGTGGRLIAYCY